MQYKSQPPKVTVITPSYNQGYFIRKTIESVLTQTYGNIECIIIDGGSTDETVDILYSYGDKIAWISEPDRGQAHAVNKGLEMASGDIIGWLNSDDIYYPDTLKKVLSFFEAHPETMVVYGDANHIDENDGVIEPYPTRPWDYECLMDECFICQPAVFFRRELFDQVGLLDKKLQYCMDYELWLRIGQQYPMVYLPELLAGSRLYAETKTLGSRRKVHEEIVQMVYAKTNQPPLRWIANLGHVIAREKGLSKDSLSQEFCFAIDVFIFIVKEHIRMKRIIDFSGLYTLFKRMVYLKIFQKRL